MLYKYQALTKGGEQKEGTIEALNQDVAISSLQKRGLVVVSVQSFEKSIPFWQRRVRFSESVPMRDVAILSQQLSTFFNAHIPTLRIFRTLAGEAEKEVLREKLSIVADDIQGGSSISEAMSKHPGIFSDFYVNMVKAGEESGKLNDVFAYLADYITRSYGLLSKTRNALIYPAFVLVTLIVVMTVLMTVVFPKLTAVLIESGQELPVFTKVLISVSNGMRDYGIFFLILLIGCVIWVVRFSRTDAGKHYFGELQISIPLLGPFFRKFFLARIADNMHTMLTSGISLVRTLEVTAAVVGNAVYKDILLEAARDVKTGEPLSASFAKHKEVSGIMVQVVKIGEETGSMGDILKMLSDFYAREVVAGLETIVSMIEPIMIVVLGLGVGFILMAVLVPIYNLSSSI